MIILPMVGRSSRFTKAGYDRPKYMLEAHGRSVLEHVIASFEACFGKEPFLFITLAADGVAGFIAGECAKLGLAPDSFSIVELDAMTEGQAETIAKGIAASGMDLNDSISIFNIDTIRPGFRYPDEYALSEVDGYLEVFNGEGEGWSFVEADTDKGNYAARRVTEKVRISDLCSTGLYYFRTAQLFLDVYESIRSVPAAELQGGERYVAPLYNVLIQRGDVVRYHEIGADEIILCGIPEQYEAFKRMTL
ncbi:MAG: capsular biosynthesis protein [Alphaproteobacteria bacterium]|nr:MAG: capsular biosynthesis protein [Alphaproteobacteria bacterium]